MSNQCARPAAVLAALVFLGISGWSQTPETFTISGELQSDSPAHFFGYRLEMTDPAHSNETHRADVQPDGSFQMREVRSATYILRVTTFAGEQVYQEYVTANPLAGPMIVRIPELAGKHSAPGTVSVTQLLHPPSRKAYQAVVSAQRFAASGQTGKAVEELEKAIRLSPEYAEAHNNLAVQHMRMGHVEEACAEFQRALAIAGPNAALLSNLAYAQLQLNRLTEAEATARAAVRLNSGSPHAHWILGSILALDPRTRAEAIPHLELAAEALPSARAALEHAHRMTN